MDEKKQEILSKNLREIANLLGLAEPLIITMSYDMGDIWIDVSLERDNGSWHIESYTLGVPLDKAKKLRELLQNYSDIDPNLYEDGSYLYANFTQHEWDEIHDIVVNFI